MWTFFMEHSVVLNDQLQGTVATHLRCGGIVNNQLRNVKKIKISEYSA